MTASQGRKFGLTLGSAFLALGVFVRVRAHPIPGTALMVLGAALAASAIVVPTYLGPIERAWMRLAHAISRVTTPIAMALLYFGVLTPVGILRRTVGAKPLVHEAVDGGYWKPRAINQRRTKNMERQF